MADSFSAKSRLTVGSKDYRYFRLEAVAGECDLAHLPYSLKILLENLLRKEDGKNVTRDDILALCRWQPQEDPVNQINFTPARVILQDFTGVPAVVDLAAMRNAMEWLGGDPAKINPLGRVDLVIDHSVQVDYSAAPDALRKNIEKEFERNSERYQFLRWGQNSFDNFRVVPPGTGIVHQVNIEYLADVVSLDERSGEPVLLPDTLVGTDSHTTMVNGLGVLGWGVGGIEAEAAMLGQPMSMLIPQVVGFELKGQLPATATATDLVLTVTQMLRKKGVVGKFVEFYGPGLSALPLADRATIANMAPEYGATCGIFPIDSETLRYLELTGRSREHIDLVEAYAKAQGMWRTDDSPVAHYSDYLSLDLSTVVPSLAGPKRPQDRINLSNAKAAFQALMHEVSDKGMGQEGGQPVRWQNQEFMLDHGDVVIAAITSCTNTSNPAVLVAAGLLARNAHARGLRPKPWVKTSFAPGSQVVPGYLQHAGLMQPLEELGFGIVGFGCTTCIGNSGPLPDPIVDAIRSGKLQVTSVLSGNRNFEGRIHPEVPANYLASPPLVVAYALAGTMDFDLENDCLGVDAKGNEVYLKDIWPSHREISDTIARSVSSDLYRSRYADVFSGDDVWRGLPTPKGVLYSWPDSTYIQQPTFFNNMTQQLNPAPTIKDARCLVMVGDSITTDHISPAGTIKADSPAGRYLINYGIEPADFNSYGSRRGNHEVMVRGTFANVRLRNRLAPGTQGGYTTHFPSGDVVSIFDGSMRYQKEDIPLIILAGKEYGTGSSRDWAAKGTSLLGVKAVIAESYERIHRSNLVGFGVLPLQFKHGENAEILKLRGDEYFTIEPIQGQPKELKVSARSADGNSSTEFTVRVRIDTEAEWDYYRHGGILHYVLRQLSA